MLCTASVEEKLPFFLKGKGQGWVTAEYGMLPRATGTRTAREAATGKQGGRTQEIQRLIGRSLRSAVDLALLGERTITIDCDVLQADGGTRTASITGGFVRWRTPCSTCSTRACSKRPRCTTAWPRFQPASTKGTPILDLDYAEDANAETDMNFVMNETGRFIEIRGTAEGDAFSEDEMLAMTKLARHGIEQLIARQRDALGLK